MTTTTKEEQEYARKEILIHAKQLIDAELDDPGPTPDTWHQFARAVYDYLDMEERLAQQETTRVTTHPIPVR